MQCEMCDKPIGFIDRFLFRHIRSAALTFIGREGWVHKECYKSAYKIAKSRQGKRTSKNPKTAMANLIVDDYNMMKAMGDI